MHLIAVHMGHNDELVQVALAKQRDQLERELRVIVEEIAVMKEAMMCI